MWNNVAAAGRYSATVEQEFGWFDALPAPVRLRLQASVVNWGCRAAAAGAEHMRKQGASDAEIERCLCRAISSMENKEMERFAGLWPRRYGQYPAIAARATALGYDEASHVRRRRAA